MRQENIMIKGYSIVKELPERWWFRYLLYIQAIVGIVNLETRHWTLQLIGLLTLYILRSPDMWIVDTGILIRILWTYRVIPWKHIRKVQITSKQIFIYDGFIIPLFAFYWRRNFHEFQQIIEEKLHDKVRKYKFPLPL